MFIFALMVLLHVIDDFVMQPVCLSKLKQKSWWEDNVRPKVSEEEWHMYREDYRMALIVHSVSWSIMIMLPFLFVAAHEFMTSGYAFNILRDSLTIAIIICNAIIHFAVDNSKANKKKIWLWEDQGIHFFQLLITFIVMSVTYF